MGDRVKPWIVLEHRGVPKPYFRKELNRGWFGQNSAAARVYMHLAKIVEAVAGLLSVYGFIRAWGCGSEIRVCLVSAAPLLEPEALDVEFAWEPRSFFVRHLLFRRSTHGLVVRQHANNGFGWNRDPGTRKEVILEIVAATHSEVTGFFASFASLSFSSRR